MNNLNTLLESVNNVLESVNNVSIKETTDYLSFSNSIMNMSTSLYESTITETLSNFVKSIKTFFDNAIKFIKKIFALNWKDPIKEILKNEKKIVKYMNEHPEQQIMLNGVSLNNKDNSEKYSEWLDTFIDSIKIKNFDNDNSIVFGPDVEWKKNMFNTKLKYVDFNVSKKLFNTDNKLIKELGKAKKEFEKRLKTNDSDEYKKSIQLMMQETTRIKGGDKQ